MHSISCSYIAASSACRLESSCSSCQLLAAQSCLAEALLSPALEHVAAAGCDWKLGRFHVLVVQGHTFLEHTQYIIESKNCLLQPPVHKLKPSLWSPGVGQTKGGRREEEVEESIEVSTQVLHILAFLDQAPLV